MEKRDTPIQLDVRKETACQECVLNGGDRSKAYRKAYPHSKRWKDKTVHEKASRLFSEDKVKARVNQLQLEAAKIAEEQFKVDATYVLQRLTEIDQMDVLDILSDDGSLKPVREWPKVWRTTLSGLDINRLRTLGGNDDQAEVESVLQKIKWPDKVKNLELIGRHVDVQAWKERVEMEVVDHAAMLEKAHKRVRRREA